VWARALVVAMLPACLASPPPSEVAADDGGPDVCGELDLFTESFEEDDPTLRFLDLWDPGEAPYVINEAALIITGTTTESDIYSRYEYERSGALRVDRTALSEGGVAALSIWNDEGAARILLDDTSTVLYAPGDHQLELARDVEDLSLAIGFDDGAILFRASHGDGAWRTLGSWPDEFTQLVRLGLGVATPSGTVEWSINGINTDVDCLPAFTARR
jgi:hypothetical protein